ncbi:Pnldc1 [Phodopus roborovskii]|uniref:Poly(A)-specific ribonuclease PNLDC1 n=1 Tax=Phodopus roborovskii TaxID=109678 RepID=A0AAV0A7X9_PHORO|nr:Pnldc1 [Phodopus roborovskii]
MDVCADNFESTGSELYGIVNESEFVSLDIEFTGLRSNSSGPQQISLFDSPSEWYAKARQSVKQFTICQIGLSVFSTIEDEVNQYVANSWNFFLFPTTFGDLDSEFSFQASSVQFLNQYGFDFNKFLKKGIPYMNEEQEKTLRQSIMRENWRVRSSLDKDQIKAVIDKVTRWVYQAEEEDQIILPGISGFQAFEVEMVLRQSLPNIWTIQKEVGVVVKKISELQRWYFDNNPCDQIKYWKEDMVDSARGFKVYFDILVNAKKPLVGHNMMMDLLHLHEKFFKPLPESYEEFKRNIHSLFPVIIDTKNVTKDIWKELHFPRVSNLLEVYDLLSSDLNPAKNTGPKIIHSFHSHRYAKHRCPHEAAYDAFLCGSVLLKVAHLLLHRLQGPLTFENYDSSFPQYFEMLWPYVNQVNLIRAGVPKINLCGPDYPSIRPPVLILTVKNWPAVTEHHVYNEFHNVCKFDVRRFTQYQFLLLTNKFKDVRSVLKEYRNHPIMQVSLYRYWKHSPDITCLLKVCGIITAWATVAFVLGRSSLTVH